MVFCIASQSSEIYLSIKFRDIISNSFRVMSVPGKNQSVKMNKGQ
jgi:hypothetical protein